MKEPVFPVCPGSEGDRVGGTTDKTTIELHTDSVSKEIQRTCVVN